MDSETILEKYINIQHNSLSICRDFYGKGLDELRAIKSLFSELEKGEVSARKDGWISLEEAKKKFGL